MTLDEEPGLQRHAKATSERVEVAKRARALRGVGAGGSSTQAARPAGEKSSDSISQLVERFTQQGLAARHLAGGRRRKATSTPAQRERLVADRQRIPERTNDATATWSLQTLARARRQAALPQVCARTMRGVPREAG
jgi:hypothetical protein